MIDGKLAFYMPHGVWSWFGQDRALKIPSTFEANPDGTFRKGPRLFSPTDVYVPIDVPKRPVFHTIVKCELPEDGGFDCGARALLSSWGREHYVTPSAVFLWSLPRAYMFRFEDLGVVAHKASAQPRDQFSFKLKDGTLHLVGVAEDPAETSAASDFGTAYPIPERKSRVVVESLPISAFDVYGEQSLDGKVRDLGDLAGGQSWISNNRFVGDALFLGVYTYGSSSSKSRLARFDLGTGQTVHRELEGGVARIEPIGDTRAFVAIHAPGGLRLETLSTSGDLVAQGSETLPGVAEGESRSHGFFFKPSRPGATSGTFGLPVVNGGSGSGGYGWGNGISNIGFWSVTEDGALGSLGAVSSSGEQGVCETSCVDWYGNTRPIFLGTRAFALMGSELAEIAIAPQVQRLGTAAVLTK